MSRIGQQPIEIPKGTEVSQQKNVVKVKGPKGELIRTIHPAIQIAVENGQVLLTRPDDLKTNRALHGLCRALIQNMVTGATTGFKTTQEVVGVGFRVNVQGQTVELTLGYSHTVIFELPKEIKATGISEKGKAPTLILESADKELLGMVAAKIRSLRKPDVYKGKGVRFAGEQLRLKPGKAAAGSGAASK